MKLTLKILLWPLILIGALAGFIYSGLYAGFVTTVNALGELFADD